MPLNISKIRRAKNIFLYRVFLKDDLIVQFGGKRLSKVVFCTRLVSLVYITTLYNVWFDAQFHPVVCYNK